MGGKVMTYVSVDASGNANRIEDDLVEDAQGDVDATGGALLRFDGEKVEQYEGNGKWSEV